MSIALVLRMPGATTHDYEAVLHELGLPLNMDSPNQPQGSISHVAGVTDEGLCVVDVWESREDFDRFMRDRLEPARQKVGTLPQPQVTQFEVHNMYGHGGGGHGPNGA